MGWRERIVLDPQILAGKPVVRGTRLAVEFIIDLLAQGWTEVDLVRNYPGLTREDIRACLGYASEVLHAEKVYPLQVR
ncbi:MAG: DUF433 domain-containing protein [Armatimonadota bacterium]